MAVQQRIPVPVTIQREPQVDAALAHARARRGSGNVGPRYLDLVLRYLEALEAELLAERQQRREFEAQAEGEFCELRLDRHRWRTYAAQLEGRRDTITIVIRDLLGLLQRLANTPRWRIRRRRRLRRELSELRWASAHVLSRSEPMPPAVEAE